MFFYDLSGLTFHICTKTQSPTSNKQNKEEMQATPHRRQFEMSSSSVQHHMKNCPLQNKH